MPELLTIFPEKCASKEIHKKIEEKELFCQKVTSLSPVSILPEFIYFFFISKSFSPSAYHYFYAQKKSCVYTEREKKI